MRTPYEALKFLRYLERYGTQFAVGECKQRTRQDAYNYPSDGTPSAAAAWAKTKHRFSGIWIPGSFIFWTGGSHGYGHVALCGWRRGVIRTVDYPRAGHWNTTTVATLEKAWPLLKYAGTSLDLDGVTVRGFPRIRRSWTHA